MLSLWMEDGWIRCTGMLVPPAGFKDFILDLLMDYKGNLDIMTCYKINSLDCHGATVHCHAFSLLLYWAYVIYRVSADPAGNGKVASTLWGLVSNIILSVVLIRVKWRA